VKPCFECGEPSNIEHHVVPFVLGGTKKVPLCDACHKKVHSPESSVSLSRLCRYSPRGPNKVKEAEAAEIIAMRNNGALLREIGTRFGITTTHANYVVKGKTRVSKIALSNFNKEHQP